MSQAGGFDKLLLDSLYEDENARRQLQLRNAGYGYGEMDTHNPFNHHNQQYPFASNNIAPPANVQMAFMAQQQQQHNMMMVPYQYPQTQYHHQTPVMGSFNPFDDPLPVPTPAYNYMNHQGNYHLM